jgi:predicted transcriptional regulator
MLYDALMNAEREIFDRPNESDADALADAEADADVAAGRIVDHAEVAKWLAKWGTSEEAPAPPEWLK